MTGALKQPVLGASRPSIQWTPNEWFAIDAGYAKLHYNSLGGIDFFVSQQLTSGQSLYISNIHTGR